MTVRVPGQHSEPGPDAVAVAESLDLGWHDDLREDLGPDTEDQDPGEAR